VATLLLQNVLYISLDARHNVQENDIYMGMLHEIHHAMRWRKPGYGQTLKEALLTEGLATLFEEEVTGETPIYAKVEIDSECIKKAQKEFDSTQYNHHMWFISGNNSIPRWFGYSYGYELAKEASKRLNKTAAQLVHEPVDLLI
jgi:uncharacterized protein YjaZ